jgi:hypothetical protein
LSGHISAHSQGEYIRYYYFFLPGFPDQAWPLPVFPALILYDDFLARANRRLHNTGAAGRDYGAQIASTSGTMQTEPEKLLRRHRQLVHSDMLKVTSHVQRTGSDWIVNTLMVEGCSAPFRFKRKQACRNLNGQRVNLTYYASNETVGGIAFEVMNVVRIRIA